MRSCIAYTVNNFCSWDLHSNSFSLVFRSESLVHYVNKHFFSKCLVTNLVIDVYSTTKLCLTMAKYVYSMLHKLALGWVCFGIRMGRHWQLAYIYIKYASLYCFGFYNWFIIFKLLSLVLLIPDIPCLCKQCISRTDLDLHCLPFNM